MNRSITVSRRPGDTSGHCSRRVRNCCTSTPESYSGPYCLRAAAPATSGARSAGFIRLGEKGGSVAVLVGVVRATPAHAAGRVVPAARAVRPVLAPPLSKVAAQRSVGSRWCSLRHHGAQLCHVVAIDCRHQLLWPGGHQLSCLRVGCSDLGERATYAAAQEPRHIHGQLQPGLWEMVCAVRQKLSDACYV